jgi:hypothetical protein
MKKKKLLDITIKNNTVSTIRQSMMGIGNASDISNARTRYQWDMTGVGFSPPTLSIQVRPVNGSFQTYTAALLGNNIAGIVATLNSMGIGNFWQNGNIVETYNDNLVYGQLIVGEAPPLLTFLDWINATVLAGGSLVIKVNTITVVNDANPGTNSGTISSLANGDQIDVLVNASAGEATDFVVRRSLVVAPFTTEDLYDVTVPASGSDSYSFTVNNNYSYQVIWGSP